METRKFRPGKYTLYIHIPPSGAWSLAINTDPGIELAKLWPAAPADVAKAIYPRLDGYQKNIADKEIARVPMKSGTVATAVELFTITLEPARHPDDVVGRPKLVGRCQAG